MMQRKEGRTARASDTALLICQQIRRAENTRFLRQLPGFEIRRELPTQLLGLLHQLQEAESNASQRGVQRDAHSS